MYLFSNTLAHSHTFCAHRGWDDSECLLLPKHLWFVVGVEAPTQVPVSRPASPVSSHGVCVPSSELDSVPVWLAPVLLAHTAPAFSVPMVQPCSLAILGHSWVPL